METLAIGGQMAQSADEFADWVRPHLSTLHRYAAREVGVLDADDVVQDALTRAWSRRETYDERLGAPLPWLLAIVRDRARRHRRRNRRNLRHLELRDDAVGPSTGPTGPPDPDLAAAIGQLSRRQQEVIGLYYFVDLDVATIAALLGRAPGTVRATLHQARAALRDLLGDPDD